MPVFEEDEEEEEEEKENDGKQAEEALIAEDDKNQQVNKSETKPKTGKVTEKPWKSEINRKFMDA